jgi:hypothetical protein
MWVSDYITDSMRRCDGFVGEAVGEGFDRDFLEFIEKVDLIGFTTVETHCEM